MKKLGLILTLFLLTGCLGETGKGYITKKCNKIENINGMEKETEIQIKSKKGNVEEIIIQETYDKNLDLESITDSKKSEQNSYKNIKIEFKENIFIYTLDIEKLNTEEKEKFKIKDEQHKQIKQYEQNGYTCK